MSDVQTLVCCECNNTAGNLELLTFPRLPVVVQERMGNAGSGRFALRQCIYPGIHGLPVHDIGQGANRGQLALDDLAGEQSTVPGGMAIEQGDQETGPEGVAGAGGIHDLDGASRDMRQLSPFGEEHTAGPHGEDKVPALRFSEKALRA